MTPELEAYILEHIDAEPECLTQLNRRSNLELVNGRMCSGHLQGRLLKMLTRMIAPRKVLELGTFSGYSALSIAEGLDDDAELVTVESNDELEDFIRTSLRMSEHGGKVRSCICDAMTFMRGESSESYDMIFIDADKRCYCEYYEESMRILCPLGYILADNTLWSGHVVEASYDHDAQTKGIRRFNDMVAVDSRVERVILPVRDGITIIRKL